MSLNYTDKRKVEGVASGAAECDGETENNYKTESDGKTDYILEISDLHKSFGDVRAVDGLSFKVKRGELFAFLGVNGAGKSTTISIITGTLAKDSGTVIVAGENVDCGRASASGKTGVVFQNSVLDGALTAEDNLYARASLYGIHGKEAKKRIDDLAELLDFGGILRRKVGKLSGGQRRKIDVARALLHSPELLILDEPTTGLDPQTRKTLWHVIDEERKRRGMTVLLTTHYMEEAVDSDYVVILDSGKIAAEGTPSELKTRYTGDYVTLYGVDETEVEKLGLSYTAVVGGFRIAVENTERARDLVLGHPELFCDFEIVKGSMDDVFISATGKRLEGDRV